MNTPTNAMSVEQRQRRQATILGLSLGAGCFSLMVACMIMFSQKGFPKDPKEWKRLQEQRAAAEAAAPTNKVKASGTTDQVEPQKKDQTQ